MMRCANCDAMLPEGGNFCIECGAPAAQAATGATERLPEHAGGPTCAACGTRNPPGASFCVTCGRAFGPRPLAEPPATALPPAPAPIAASPAMPPATVSPAQARRGTFSVEWGGVIGGIWLIGIAVLTVTGWWWPGIMVLLGLSALVSGLEAGGNRAQRSAAFQGAIWMFGIALIALFNWWWPGMLVLAGLSAIIGAISRNTSVETN
jgi:hypothetical protein